MSIARGASGRMRTSSITIIPTFRSPRSRRSARRRPTPPPPKSMGWSCSSTHGWTERTDVTFGAQLLKARFKRFPNAICTDFSADAAIPYAPITCDVTGNRLPFAPEVQVQCRRKPSGLAGQDRHLGAERKSRLQFGLFRGTRQCRAAGSFRDGRCIGGMAADPARPVGSVLGAQSHRCPLL